MKYYPTLLLLMISLGVSAQRVEDAQRAFDAEQYQSAKSTLKALVKVQPKTGDYYYALGNVYLKTGYVDSAKAVFTQGIRADAKNPLNHVGMGKLHLISGSQAIAKVDFDKAVSLSSRRKYQAHLAIGTAYTEAQMRDLTAALPYLQKADELDKSDKDAQVFLALGDYYAAQGSEVKALANYSKAQQLDPAGLRAGVQIAAMYVKSGIYPKADSILKTVLATNANYGPAYRVRAEMHLQQFSADPSLRGAAASAVENYKRYLDVTDRSFDSRLNFALLLYRLKDFHNLEAELSGLSSLSNGGAKALLVHRLRGFAAYENGNYPAAMQYMNALFEGTSNKREITSTDYAYMSLIEQKLKLDQPALEHASKAIGLDSSKTAALERIARTYYNSRNWEKAISSYEHMKQLGGKPNDVAEVSLYHGTALFFKYVEAFNKRENPSGNLLLQATSLFDQVLQHSADRTEAHLWSGRALRLLENQPNSQAAMVTAYQAYIDASERSSVVQSAATKRNLMEAFNVIAADAASRGEADKARSYWSKALTLDPQDVTATGGIKGLNGTSRRGSNR